MRRLVLISSALLAAACSGRLDVSAAPVSPPVDSTTPDAGTPFQAVSPAQATAKVKMLLTGSPPTDDEIAQVTNDPSALKTLVDGWSQSPEYTVKLQSFFATAFQQSQVLSTDFGDQGADADDGRVLQNLRESFARTAVQLVSAGHSFGEVATTQQFMLTPRIMALYALVDAINIDDTNKTVDTFAAANPTFKVTFEAAQGPIALADSLNPASPNYMTFYAPQLATSYDAACPNDPLVYSIKSGMPSITNVIYFGAFRGQMPAFNITVSGANHTCRPPNGTAIWQPSDFTTWQMVNVRQPNPGEATTPVYDALNFRAGHELVLKIPRVGFFTTPAFFAGWQTNQSNQARVTLNQTLIVALGRAISPTTITTPPSEAALDEQHAAPGTTCFVCHQSLDPMRQYFRQAYSLHFSPQTAKAETQLPGQFGFLGQALAGSTIFDLGKQLANHADFAQAWAQKLCTYANSAPCAADDPEFQRIVAAFAASGLQWSTLTRELYSSPIVTNLAANKTAKENGQTFPIARRDHLCATLSQRLKITDFCGLDVNTVMPGTLANVRTIASVLPSDQYSRGSEDPVLANDPSLIYRTGLENLCAAAAQTVIDQKNSLYTSKAPVTAIASFVHDLMGLGAGRDSSRIALLQAHFLNALNAGETESDSLKSTFVLACLSPSVAGVGQ